MSAVAGTESRLLASIPADPFGELIGIEHEILEEGRVRSRVALRPEHLNPFRDGHGAVAFALADTGMGRALVSALPARARCATQSATIQYLEPAGGSALVAESMLVHLGEKVASVRCDVFREDGKLCAVATATFYVSTREGNP